MSVYYYKYFQGSDDPWFCATCCCAVSPLVSLNNTCFLSVIPYDEKRSRNNKKQVETKDTSLLLNPSPNLALLFSKFNNTWPEMNDDPENVVNSVGLLLNILCQPLTKFSKIKRA